jgi:mono/diheme cytochrome c family protein
MGGLFTVRLDEQNCQRCHAVANDSGCFAHCCIMSIRLPSTLLIALTSGTIALAAEPAAPTPAPKADQTAKQFLQSCAGCHTIGGGVLNGPDLIESAAWKKEDLKPAIKRMEQRVGPMTDEEIDALADLIADPNANQRLKVAEAAIQQLFAAKLQPSSAVTGRELYFGRKGFVNGGMACSACHAVKGNGGLLGPDLTGIHAKMGETPLVSSIEKSAFKVMAAAYRTHPVTKQEAMHVAKFLGSLQNEPQATRAPVWPLGAAGAGLFLVGLVALKRQHRSGQRMRLERRRK